jgi:hypothetical protein
LSTEAGRLAAYADLVAALLDLSDPAPSATFDGALDAAVADGSLTPEQARRLRWLQRESVRRLVDHARTVLPSTLVALESELTGGVGELPDPAAVVVDAATSASAAPAATDGPLGPDDPEGSDGPDEPVPPVDLHSRRLLVAGLRPLPDGPRHGTLP